MKKNTLPITKLHWGQNLTLFLFVCLVVGFSVWQLSRPEGPSYFFWFIQVFPLVIFIPGMINNNPRTYIMLCFVLLMYFIQGVSGVMSPSPTWVDYLMLSISILLFISAMLTSRWAAMSLSKRTQSKTEVNDEN